MATIPLGVAKYIHSIWMTETDVTYLYIDSCDNLISWGGSPHHYGLIDLIAGLPVGEQVNFLEGLLPAPDTQVLPFLSIDEQHSAHVHIVPFDNSTWVLLFDATSEYEQQQKMQQQINDLKLLAYQQNQLIQALEQALKEEKRHNW